MTAFGKREKEYDELIGRSADIDKTSLDIIDVNGSDDEEDDDDGDPSSGLRGGGVGNTVNKVNYSAVSTGKVRIMIGIYMDYYFNTAAHFELTLLYFNTG